MKFKLDENLPASSAAILTGAGHDVNTVIDEDLNDPADPHVVAADPASLSGSVAVLQRGLLCIRHP